ncbi:hypothetical protein HMPREF9141_0025 [Prevotella multiformis DSM 16608]|uniref:Uncharacterized protein n=1 Tax=Prevotella multiformis DSM 16608 TaxID=888743 RepID=F0F359_9BACT|nr:hypothetical protein HMPREF9141_0025 [Prevotella multiformis DSM 16608]
MGISRLWKTERQADGQASHQCAFSASYLAVYPPLQGHLISDSHAMQVHKPLFYSPSTHLMEEAFKGP